MPELQDPSAWQRARLFSTVGISSKEQEARATSALLAALPAVPSFGKALLASLGAPAGSITAFTEVRLQDGGGVSHVPAGAVVVPPPSLLATVAESQARREHGLGFQNVAGLLRDATL